jgi:hypothetical protein
MAARGPYQSRFVLDQKGNEALLATIASGLNAFTGEVAEGVRQAAPKGARGTARPLRTTEGGVYVFYGRPGGSVVRYRRTIHHSTYLGGKLVAGPPVRGIGRSNRTVRSVVYSTSFTAHLLELGTTRHEIPVVTTVMRGPLASRRVSAIHRGSRRYPHFWPGLVRSLPAGLAAMARVGVMASRMGGRLNTRAL